MKQNKSWWILVVVSLGVLIPFIFPYLTFNPEASRIKITSDSIQYPVLLAHIIFALIAVITGFLQFVKQIRISYKHVHRYIGRIYVCSVFISGLLSFVVILYIEDFTKAASFLTLTILWLFTTWKGYRTAVKRRIMEHRKWMLRSFGITLVAVSGRIIVPFLLLTYYIFNGFTLPEGRNVMVAEVLNVNIWVGIILNFVIVEWIILSRKNKDIQ